MLEETELKATYDDLITSLITLKLILEDIDKISIVIDLEINRWIKQLELLEEELRIVTLRKRFLGRSRSSIEEELDKIEELKEDLKCEVKDAKVLQDFNYEKNDEIVEIAKTALKLQRLGASKKSVNFFKNSIIPKRHLHLVL